MSFPPIILEKRWQPSLLYCVNKLRSLGVFVMCDTLLPSSGHLQSCLCPCACNGLILAPPAAAMNSTRNRPAITPTQVYPPVTTRFRRVPAGSGRLPGPVQVSDLHYSAQLLRSTIHSLWKTGCPPIFFLSVLEQAVSVPTLLPQSQPA